MSLSIMCDLLDPIEVIRHNFHIGATLRGIRILYLLIMSSCMHKITSHAQMTPCGHKKS